jgi:YNFM family putative membrane transporter
LGLSIVLNARRKMTASFRTIDPAAMQGAIQAAAPSSFEAPSFEAALIEPIRHGTTSFRRTNLALFAAGLATFSLLYCVQPLMPIFSHAYGVSAAASALSLSLTTGVLAVAMLFAGGISDAWGRKSVMAISLISSAVLVVLSAMAPDWHTLLLLRTLLGLTLSGLPAVAMTYLAEEVHPESIGLGMGLYISGNALGGMGGRLVAGVIADFYGWRIGVATVGVIGVVAGAIFLRTLPPSQFFVRQPLRLKPLLHRFGDCFRDAGLPWMFLEGFLLLGAFVTVYNYVGYRLLGAPYHLSQAVIGLIFSVYLIGSFSSAWMGALAGRLGRRKVLWTVFALMLAGVLLTLAQPLWLIVLGIVAITFGFFGGHSIVSSWTGRRAGSAKAQASSLYLFSYYMGSSLAGAGGGLFYAAHGWNGVAAFIGAMLLLGLLVAWRLYHLTPLPGPPSPGTEPTIPERA